MRAQHRIIARKQLDKRLLPLSSVDSLARPPQGWIKAIREALGMTTAQLARRLGVSQPRIIALEKGEASGAITLETLARAAEALDCRLVYTLVPRKPLEALVDERAAALAKKRLGTTRHTMALEDQSVEAADETAQLERLTQQIVNQPGSKLWDEE
jgi:predicted DNA-binding mobile mystery protein A